MCTDNISGLLVNGKPVFVTEMYYRDPSGKLLMVVVGVDLGPLRLCGLGIMLKNSLFLFLNVC